MTARTAVAADLAIKDSAGDVVEPGKPGDIQLTNTFTIDRLATIAQPELPTVDPPTGKTGGTLTGTTTLPVGAPPGTTPAPPDGTGHDWHAHATSRREARGVAHRIGVRHRAQRMGANDLFSTLIDAVEQLGASAHAKDQ